MNGLYKSRGSNLISNPSRTNNFDNWNTQINWIIDNGLVQCRKLYIQNLLFNKATIQWKHWIWRILVMILKYFSTSLVKVSHRGCIFSAVNLNFKFLCSSTFGELFERIEERFCLLYNLYLKLTASYLPVAHFEINFNRFLQSLVVQLFFMVS